VPHELALDLDQLDVAVVEVGDDPGIPAIVEPGELLGEVDPGDHGMLLEG
jgi:hypothetical protein